MKYIKFLFVLLTNVSIMSCGKKSLKYDFSKIESQMGVDSLLKQMKLDNKTMKLDTLFYYNHVTVSGMHYAGVPIKEATITKNYTELTTDSTDYYGKKLLEVIETKNGIAFLKDHEYGEDIDCNWNSTETKQLSLKLKLISGKHLAALTSKDYAKLTIYYNKTYNIPLANIHKKIKVFKRQPQYVLKIDGYYTESTVIANGVIINENVRSSNLHLNPFITKDTTLIKITVLPSKKNYEDRSKFFDKYASFSASVYDKSNNDVLVKTEKVMLEGKETKEFQLVFSANLPWYPEAWTNGSDLRSTKDLKQKVIALYDKIGNAVITKNEDVLNDIFYQRNYETQQLEYDTDFLNAKDQWEALLRIQENAYAYTVADTFEIEYNANGKLIFAYPINKEDMLTLTGKRYGETMNYFLYQPKGTNELKIIR